MKLVAFLQLYNELENGNLIRCLRNCKAWADEIFIYDDCSTDGSFDVYLDYTDRGHILAGSEHQFNAELFHKKALLDLTLKSNPDWIGWIDGDTTLCKWIVENCRDFLPKADEKGFDSLRVHNLNLWRHPAYYRLDNQFNDLWHTVFWRNNGMLHYKQPLYGLHRQQMPDGLQRWGQLAEDQTLLHYGFASETAIARKYLTYKGLGQKGHDLDRLIDEQSSFKLEKVPRYMYPDEDVPPDYDTAPMPVPILYSEYRDWANWDQYRRSKGI